MSEQKALKAYLLFEVVIFIAIKVAEFTLTRQYTKFIMYSAIVGNTVMALYLRRRYDKSASDGPSNCVFAALMVNCVADVFLTLTGGPTMYIPGFAAFCTVEALYAASLRPDTRNLVIRVLVFAASLVFAWSIRLLTLPNALGLLNLSLLGVNVVCAWLAYRRTPGDAARLFAWGLTSFIVGDISVALEIMLPEGTTFQRVATLAVWTFYVPAQVLIVLSYRQRLKEGALASR